MKSTIKFLLFTVIVLVFTLNAFSQVPNYVPTNGLVGYWPFNGNANDESGNGNNGTVNGAALTIDRYGNINNAYFFNHTDEILTNYNGLSGSQPRTISFWMKNQNSSKTINPIWYGGDPNQPITGSAFNIIFNRNEQNDPCNCWPTTYEGIGISADWIYTLRSTIIGDNQWHHWLVSLENAGDNFNQVKYYKDGVLISASIIFDYNNNGSTIVNTSNISPLKFGKSSGLSNNPDRAATEYLDDIGVWNRALTPQEITNLYTSTVPVSCLPAYVPTSGLVGYWPFCGNANDESGNGNNGTVNGATLTSDRNGNINSAFSFDGVNDYIDLGNNSNFNINTPKTFSFWTKDLNHLDFQSAYLSKNTGYGAQNKFIIGRDANSGNFFLHTQTTLNNGNWYNSNLPSSNNWYHVIVSVDANTLSFYSNGLLVYSSNIINPTQPSNAPLLIGISEPTFTFHGLMDDLGIWNRALTQQEITNLYTSSVPPTAAVLSGDATICLGSSTNLSVAVTGGTAPYTVTVTDGTNNYSATGASPVSIPVSPTATSTYSIVSVTGGGTGTGNIGTATVTVIDATITASDSVICAGDSVTLSVPQGGSSNTACAALPTNLQTGLVGYWPFCGNANDESGNGNNGTVNGATLTTDRFGNANGAYSLSGTSNSILVNDSPSLDFPQGVFSLCAEVKLSGLGVEQGLIDHFDVGGPSVLSRYTLRVLPNNKIRFNLKDDENDWSSVDSDISLDVNVWYSIVGVFNYATQELHIYINGEIHDGTIIYNALTGPAITPPNSLFLGNFAGAYNLNGTIDNVSIYNRALSPSDIQQLYTLGQSTYLWSTGATTATINISPTSTTTYTCTTTTNGVSCTDSVTIVVNNPTINLGNDVNACGTSTTLTAPTGYDSYLWSNGATTNTTTVSANGTYSCMVTQGLCSSSDTLEVVLITLNAQASSTSICAGASVELTGSSNLNLNQNSNCIGNSGSPNPWPYPSAYNAGIIDLGNIGAQNVFSISAWVNAGATQNGISILLDASHGGSANWVVQAFGNNTYTWGSLSFTLTPNVWQHVLLTYVNGSKKCYIDGQLVASVFNPISYSGSPQLYLGNWPEGGRRFNGLVDELYISYSELESANFTPLQVVNSPSANSFGLWHFDEGSNGTAVNSVNGSAAQIGSWFWATRPIVSNATISWNGVPGSAVQTVSPMVTTTYFSSVTMNSVTCSDSVTVVVNNPIINLGSDVTACGTSTTLTAPTGFDSYLWSNGATTNTITVTSNGTYTCTLTQGGCSASDSIDVTLIDATISASANTVCSGTAVTITASANGLIESSQDTLLVETTSMNMFYPFSYTSTALQSNVNYLLKVYGTVGFAGNIDSQDAAFQYNWFGSPVSPYPFPNASSVWWFVNGSNLIRPTPDIYNPSHIYYFNYTGNGQPLNISWTDSPYSDNSGQLNFALYRLSDNVTTTYLWSNGATTPSITVSPTTTTTYTCTTTTNGVSCSSNYTITVNNSSASTNIVTAFDSFTWLDGNTYTESNNTATYTTTNAAGCDSVISLNLTITPNSATLSLQVFLDGYYINSLNPAAMTAARYNNLVASGSANPGANTDVDIITVELRSPSNLDVVAYSVSPILQTNGSVQCVFPAGALGGSFYIVVKHRAAIPLWSAVPMLISNGTAINFSNNVINSFSDGDPLYPSVHELNPGLYGLWMGELYYDSYLDGNDYPLFEVDVNSSSYADLYLLNGDLNGNTYVDASDYSVFNYNSQQGVYEQRPYAITTNVSIGQSYQGGIVAYILQPGDFGYDANVQHGLIAAPNDQGTAQWGCNWTTAVSGAYGQAIGTGAQNTIDIMNGCSEVGIAARLCGDLVLDGYSDWYLPSLDELNKLYLNKVAIGGFAAGDFPISIYWSSTAFNNGNNDAAWGLFFYDGIQNPKAKVDYLSVRAVRAF